eukprot:6192182-Pleurochrysis_carterae.AAC.1
MPPAFLRVTRRRCSHPRTKWTGCGDDSISRRSMSARPPMTGIGLRGRRACAVRGEERELS